MNEKLKVSIIIPVFNEAEVIEQIHLKILSALDSLSYDFSVIYVDDGSGDGTDVILDKIAAQDERFPAGAVSPHCQVMLGAPAEHGLHIS